MATTTVTPDDGDDVDDGDDDDDGDDNGGDDGDGRVNMLPPAPSLYSMYHTSVALHITFGIPQLFVDHPGERLRRAGRRARRRRRPPSRGSPPPPWKVHCFA